MEQEHEARGKHERLLADLQEASNNVRSLPRSLNGDTHDARTSMVISCKPVNDGNVSRASLMLFMKECSQGPRLVSESFVSDVFVSWCK
jgi:hypothetical protein